MRTSTMSGLFGLRGSWRGIGGVLGRRGREMMDERRGKTKNQENSKWMSEGEAAARGDVVVPLRFFIWVVK